MLLITPSPLVYGAVYAQIVPAAALLAGRNRSRPAILVVSTFLLSLITDLIGRYVAHRTGNNLWVSLVSGGCVTTMLMLAFAEWQVSAVERLAFRIAVLPFLLLYGTLIYFLDGITTFSRFSYPFGILVVLGGALWTLLRRGLATTGVQAVRTDWFLILVGVALNAATTLISSPVASVLMADGRVDLVVRFWEVRGTFVILSIALVAMGVFRAPAETEAVA